jgi:8-oxo-dGTP pyrophosphatase MutT (NUDIX family)
MIRQSLLAMLQEYEPADTQEQFYKKEMVAFIQKYEQCFERSLEIGHVTASAWLVNKDNSKALLMHHAKLNKWFQLGGHCDGNPDVVAVALKEASEESGIQSIESVHADIFDVDIHFIPATSREKEHYHYDVRFLLKVTSDENTIQNRESKELRWIGKNSNELPTESPSVVRMFNKWVDLR